MDRTLSDHVKGYLQQGREVLEQGAENVRAYMAQPKRDAYGHPNGWRRDIESYRTPLDFGYMAWLEMRAQTTGEYADLFRKKQDDLFRDRLGRAGLTRAEIEEVMARPSFRGDIPKAQDTAAGRAAILGEIEVLRRGGASAAQINAKMRELELAGLWDDRFPMGEGAASFFDMNSRLNPASRFGDRQPELPSVKRAPYVEGARSPDRFDIAYSATDDQARSVPMAPERLDWYLRQPGKAQPITTMMEPQLRGGALEEYDPQTNTRRRRPAFDIPQMPR